jgi:AcrR family transcriptional regulator
VGRAFDAEPIYGAVCELLAEIGYDRLTMDAVATRAQASKATLYRHWTGKADLVVSAVKRRPNADNLLPDTGNLRDDLRGLMDSFRCKISSSDGSLFLGILKAMQDDPDLATAMRDRMQAQWAPINEQLMTRAAARGEVHPGIDSELPISACLAELHHRHVVRGENVSTDHIDRLVDEVLLPSLTRKA